jgi:ornithine decarboxylase
MTSTLPHRLPRRHQVPRQRTEDDRLLPPTPYLELDVPAAVAHFVELARALPGTAVHYAVKANPHPLLLAELAAVGCRFDVASPAEVRAALAAGSTPESLVYSNPVKRRDHVTEAAALGVRLFVVDSLNEVEKVAESAPGSQVLCRLVTSGEGSDWPLSRKYGCSTYEAVEVLTLADQLGLDAAGISFHVGSQQRDPEAWAKPIKASAHVFELLRSRGISPRILDLGGGFPASHEDGCRPVAAYGAAIERHLEQSFGTDRPETLVEPGRGIVGDAGTLVSTVIGVVDRGGVRWVFLDAGVFTGLVETLEEAIRYRLRTTADGGVTRPCVLAGPTCDSADVLYQDRMVELPVALAEGDEVRLLSAGAYTSCYSTVGFNGFAPLPTVLRTTKGVG